MLITFDIDDTIRLHGNSEATEPPNIPWAVRLFYREPIRWGFIRLCTELRAQGCKIGIYTTSSRGVGYIRRWMRCYGFKPDLIVNAAIHESAVSGRYRSIRAPSKHPGLFGVDLHVDDSEGVAQEGERFGFRTLILKSEDADWCRQVLECVRSLAVESKNKSEQGGDGDAEEAV